MDNLKNQFQEKLLYTDREGIENVIKHLEMLGFFEAPALTRFHLNIKGGNAKEAHRQEEDWIHGRQEGWSQGLCRIGETGPDLTTVMNCRYECHVF